MQSLASHQFTRIVELLKLSKKYTRFVRDKADWTSFYLTGFLYRLSAETAVFYAETLAFKKMCELG